MKKCWGRHHTNLVDGDIHWTEHLGALVSQTDPQDYWPKYWVARDSNNRFLTALTTDSSRQWCLTLAPGHTEKFVDIGEAKTKAEEWILNSS